jgi:AraC family transcriptional regulator
MLQPRMRSGLDASEKMRFSLRASSGERFWSGFEAATYDISAGTQEKAPSPHYGLIMHLGPATYGTCRCEGPALNRLMKAGDMDLIPVGCGAMWRDEAPGRVLNVRLSPGILRAAAESSQRISASVAPKLQFNDPIVEHLAWALVFELENGDASDRLLAESIGAAIALQLVQKHTALSPLSLPRGLSRRQLNAVTSYIHEHLAENLSLVELAALVGVSPSHFKVLFKLAVGVPVHQYVIRCRVDYAVRLLAQGETRLCDVAQQSGFAHQSHMTRCMRRMLGMTPGAALREFWNDATKRPDV